MTQNECIFCKIARGDIPSNKIFENEHSIAFLDINPVNPGHTLLIHKEHHKDLYEMPDDCLSQIAPVIKKIAEAVKEGTGAEGINIGMNNEEAAGQIVPHAHFHIIPRFSGDGHKTWNKSSYSEGEAEKIAEKIKKTF